MTEVFHGYGDNVFDNHKDAQIDVLYGVVNNYSKQIGQLARDKEALHKRMEAERVEKNLRIEGLLKDANSMEFEIGRLKLVVEDLQTERDRLTESNVELFAKLETQENNYQNLRVLADRWKRQMEDNHSEWDRAVNELIRVREDCERAQKEAEGSRRMYADLQHTATPMVWRIVMARRINNLKIVSVVDGEETIPDKRHELLELVLNGDVDTFKKDYPTLAKMECCCCFGEATYLDTDTDEGFGTLYCEADWAETFPHTA